MPRNLGAPLVGMTGHAAKDFSTLQARAALLGATLHELPDDTGCTEFIVSRWHLTKCFATLAEVEAWIRRVGGLRP